MKNKNYMIDNNPMKRPEVVAKMKETRKHKIAEGEIIIWNKGLTKETDERIKEYASKKIGTKNECTTKRNLEKNPMNNLITREKSSKTKKRQYHDGKTISWNKNIIGEDYKKHYKDNRVWSEGKTHFDDLRIRYGEKINTFNNWSSFEPYTKEFNKSFKLAIKQRDGFMCLKCGMREEDTKQLFNKGLITHHIDYIKENTFKENCCAVCLRCNAEVNFNRVSWTKFFQSLLSERYGYRYSENGEIIINLQEGVKNEK